MMAKTIELLKLFLKRKKIFPNNKWLYGEDLEIYVRDSEVFIKDEDFIKAIQLANIKSLNPGKGLFTHFLNEAEKLGNIYIENVYSKRFKRFFVSNGYHGVPDSYCFYKLKGE